MLAKLSLCSGWVEMGEGRVEMGGRVHGWGEDRQKWCLDPGPARSGLDPIRSFGTVLVLTQGRGKRFPLVGQ